MGIVNETIEDGVGVSGIADNFVPAVDGELGSNHRGAASVAFLEDFQKVETFQDYNRTCLPRLTPAPGATAIPGRYLYPSNERNSNPNIPAPSQQPVRNQNDPNACP